MPTPLPKITSEDSVAAAPVNLWLARTMIFVAAALWSTSGFFAKAHLFDGWSGGLLAFWRAVFAAGMLIPFVRRPAWSPWLIPMVFCFAAMNWTYLTALKQGLAATAIWLQMTAPLWVLLVGVLVFHEAFHRRDALLIGFGALGVLVILLFELRGANPFSVVYGLASGVCYAAVVICLRQLRGMDAVWMAALNLSVTAVCMSPFLFASAESPSGGQWLYLAAFGILQMAIPYVLFAHGLRAITGHEAGGIGLIEPVLVPVWTYLAWGEQVTWPIICGASLIFVGLALRYLGALRYPSVRGYYNTRD